jgi:hypothetical protein
MGKRSFTPLEALQKTTSDGSQIRPASDNRLSKKQKRSHQFVDEQVLLQQEPFTSWVL